MLCHVNIWFVNVKRMDPLLASDLTVNHHVVDFGRLLVNCE